MYWSGGHSVVGLDPDAEWIARLRAGQAPLLEPGLDHLIASGLASGNLRFETDAAAAVADAEVLWVTFDTPVDDNDVPQVSRRLTGALFWYPRSCPSGRRGGSRRLPRARDETA